MYVFMYVFIYVFMSVFMYVFMYVHTFFFFSFSLMLKGRIKTLCTAQQHRASFGSALLIKVGPALCQSLDTFQHADNNFSKSYMHFLLGLQPIQRYALVAFIPAPPSRARDRRTLGQAVQCSTQVSETRLHRAGQVSAAVF